MVLVEFRDVFVRVRVWRRAARRLRVRFVVRRVLRLQLKSLDYFLHWG